MGSSSRSGGHTADGKPSSGGAEGREGLRLFGGMSGNTSDAETVNTEGARSPGDRGRPGDQLGGNRAARTSQP